MGHVARLGDNGYLGWTSGSRLGCEKARGRVARPPGWSVGGPASEEWLASAAPVERRQSVGSAHASFAGTAKSRIEE